MSLIRRRAISIPLIVLLSAVALIGAMLVSQSLTHAAKAVCGSQPVIYNFSNAPGYGPAGSVELNGWLDNCVNYSTPIYPGQNSVEFTDPDARFDPEFIGTTFCWQVNGVHIDNWTGTQTTMTINWNSPGASHSAGYAWAAVGGSGQRYDVRSVTPTHYSGCP